MKAEETVLVLRTCNSALQSYGGFQWPVTGPVEAPDWRDDERCGGGLHGLLWGEGNGALLGGRTKRRWLVVEVPKDGIRDLGGKVKFRRGEVLYCGDLAGAEALIRSRRPHAAVCYGTATAGDYGTATAGFHGTATAGEGGTATAGDFGTATAGYCGTATSGDYGTATAGEGGTATAGVGGTATAGYGGTAAVGDGGIAITGEGGTAIAGEGGTIVIRWWDSEARRVRVCTGSVGETGDLRPNTPYYVNGGRFVQGVRP